MQLPKANVKLRRRQNFRVFKSLEELYRRVAWEVFLTPSKTIVLLIV